MKRTRPPGVSVYILGIGMSIVGGCWSNLIIVSAESLSFFSSQPLSENTCHNPVEKQSLFCTVDPFVPRCEIDTKAPAVLGVAVEAEESPSEDIVAPSVPIAPRPAPAAPVRVKQAAAPAAPMPYMYKMKDGKRVCPKKNDKPSKSKKYDKVHMDMECCLDPDEIPNPNCHYPEEKYGKYLKKSR